MKKEYIIQRSGKDFVLYEGLLDEAHQQGLSRISTTLIQIPTQDNSGMAIVTAEVETSKGVYSGIGDASPSNVNRMIVPHILRMAETRAKARALRDAVNIGTTALEELGDADQDADSDDEVAYGTRTVSRASGEIQERGNGSGPPKASPYKPASANQLATIAKLSRLLGQAEVPSEDMTSADASQRITELSREYNERKAESEGTRRRSV